jgi:hypothetical protein
MARIALVVIALLMVVFVVAQQSLAVDSQPIKKCLKNKECLFTVTEASSTDPRMSFLVLRRVWNKFGEKDKADLRATLKEKLRDAREKPEKYVTSSSKSPAYDALLKNIKGMRSYAVSICYSRSDGSLFPTEEILANY